ncbi:MAG: hypothetical protein ACRCZF_10785 [Gemmataceae bacterium]
MSLLMQQALTLIQTLSEAEQDSLARQIIDQFDDQEFDPLADPDEVDGANRLEEVRPKKGDSIEYLWK